jgi:hypothetical protein
VLPSFTGNAALRKLKSGRIALAIMAIVAMADVNQSITGAFPAGGAASIKSAGRNGSFVMNCQAG